MGGGRKSDECAIDVPPESAQKQLKVDRHVGVMVQDSLLLLLWRKKGGGQFKRIRSKQSFTAIAPKVGSA